MSTLEQEIRRTLILALNEDHAAHDITSQACIPAESQTKAHIILKQSARVAGLIILPILCELLKLQFSLHAQEGNDYSEGTILATLEGPSREILAVERTLLNLIQHASGIATTTMNYVNAVKDYNCDILDTRKTLPGLRAIQKYAVTIGGGKNHRFHLEDRFLVKDNHIKLLEGYKKPVIEAIKRARILQPNSKIEVEVANLEMFEDALSAGADLILLDNMSVQMVTDAVRINQQRAYLEASGGMDLTVVRDYAATGVNGISIGALTHSVNSIDISMKV